MSELPEEKQKERKENLHAPSLNKKFHTSTSRGVFSRNSPEKSQNLRVPTVTVAAAEPNCKSTKHDKIVVPKSQKTSQKEVTDWLESCQEYAAKTSHSHEEQLKPPSTLVEPFRTQSEPPVFKSLRIRIKEQPEMVSFTPSLSSVDDDSSNSDFTQALSDYDDNMTPLPDAEEERIEEEDSLDVFTNS